MHGSTQASSLMWKKFFHGDFPSGRSINNQKGKWERNRGSVWKVCDLSPPIVAHEEAVDVGVGA